MSMVSVIHRMKWKRFDETERNEQNNDNNANQIRSPSSETKFKPSIW